MFYQDKVILGETKLLADGVKTMNTVIQRRMNWKGDALWIGALLLSEGSQSVSNGL